LTPLDPPVTASISVPRVASYCTTFLKPEMLHIYRQVTGLRRWQTFVVCRERLEADRFPFDDVVIPPVVRSNFLRRAWLKYGRREPAIVYRGEYGALAGVLDARQADLLHVYFGHTGVHLLPFLRRWPKPAVVSFHGMDVQTRADRPGYEASLRALLAEIPLVLVRSESLRDRVMALGAAPEKVRLNRTGIPLDAFPWAERARPAEGAWHFVQACRLIEKKGLEVSLRAFARFASAHAGARLTIAGEGPLREALGRLAAELGVADRVGFAGFMDQAALRDLYHRAHVFVHPSQMTADQNQEGIPNSMLEAMATGLPVLATLHGGIPEAVRHGVTGLLVPERDEDGILDGMVRLASLPGVWEEMGRAAAADMRENFEHAAQIAKLEGFYDEALSTRPR
jgi:colanic acid/amylovoran biosynthesis glycosyltransferase